MLACQDENHGSKSVGKDPWAVRSRRAGIVWGTEAARTDQNPPTASNAAADGLRRSRSVGRARHDRQTEDKSAIHSIAFAGTASRRLSVTKFPAARYLAEPIVVFARTRGR